MKNIVIVNRNNKAVIYNAENKKYSVVEDTNTSMAALKATIAVLEKLDENATEQTTIIIPRSLSLMLQLTRPQAIKDNGYMSEDGEKQYTTEYIDYMCYINELRQYYTTKVVQMRIQGSNLITKEQGLDIQAAWKAMDQIENPAVTASKIKRPVQRPKRPQSIKVGTIDTDILQ